MEERAHGQQVRVLTKRLEEGVAAVLSGEKWAEWLRLQSRFHSYSFNNTLLIWMQRPRASRVAGYRTWQSLDRQVRRGEKGIQIFAPIRKKVVIDEETGDEGYVRVGFKTVTVFDISQTEGPDLPTLAVGLSGETDSARKLFAALLSVITIPVAEDYDGPGYGCFDRAANHIRLKPGVPLNHKVKTLAHEFVHSLVHHQDAKRVPREQREAVAEGAAYVICNHFSLDTSTYSFEYVAAWAGDVELVRTVGEEIQHVAADVIDRLYAATGAMKDPAA